ncbi:MAG: helix-turn-helix transcriptional regulator [Bacteroidota bacterium]
MNTQINTMPAGFQPAKSEFFVMNGEVQFIEDRLIHPFDEITIDQATTLRQELDADHKALAGLDLLGVTDPIEQLKQFVFCRFGEFDKIADLDENGITHSEYWDCGRRPCAADGLLCKFPEVKSGHLTHHDLVIIRMVAKDLTNQQIAAYLGTSVHTVNKECQQIAHKIGGFSKSIIAFFAGKNNIH